MDSQVRRPMTMGLPIVNALKRFKSSEIFHGSPPSAPITLFVDAATMMLIMALDRNRGFDVRVRLVIENVEVFELVIENAIGFATDGQLWQR